MVTRWFDRLLNIRPEEWSRLLQLYVLVVVFMIGWTWGATITEAAFWSNVGIDALPYFLIAKAALSIPAVAIYSAFADRVRNGTLLVAIFALGGVAVAAGLVLYFMGYTAIAISLLYMVVFIPFEDIFWSHFYVWTSDYFDTRVSKRVLPVLSTSIIVSGIAAGFSLPLMNQLFSTGGILAIWLVLLLAAAVFTAVLPRLPGITAGQDLHVAAPSPQTRLRDYLVEMLAGSRYVLHTSFLRWMAAATLLIMILLAFLEYQTGRIMLAVFTSEEQISSFNGLVVGISNVILLPFQLFLLGRIISRFGLGNANLIFPAGNALICTWLVAAPALPAATFAYFSRVRFFGSVGYLTDSLLYNAIPTRIRGRARVFISGLLIPIGSSIGGLLLLALVTAQAEWLVLPTIGVLAFTYLLSTVIIRSLYPTALLETIEEDMDALLAPGRAELPAGDPTTLRMLDERLQNSVSDQSTIFLAQLISQVGGNDAIPILERTLQNARSSDVKVAILSLLAAAPIRPNVAQQLFQRFLSDPAPGVRQAAIASLERISHALTSDALTRVEVLLGDPDVAVQVQAARLLLDGSPAQRERAAQTIQTILQSSTPPDRVQGGRAAVAAVLNQKAPHDLFNHELVALCRDPDDDVRLTAVNAVQQLAEQSLLRETDTAALHQHFDDLLRDANSRVRQAASSVAACTDYPRLVPALVERLVEERGDVRYLTLELLAQQGTPASQAMLPLLEHDERRYRVAAVAALVRIDPQTYQPRMLALLDETLRVIYQDVECLAAYAPYANTTRISVLYSSLCERIRERLDDVFFVLAARHDRDAVNAITRALGGDIAHLRASAVEALESLTTPQTAHLIEPLFKAVINAPVTAQLGREVWQSRPLTLAAAVTTLAYDGDPWFRTVTLFSLPELATATPATPADDAATGTPATDEAATTESPAKRRRRAASNKLSQLFNEDSPSDTADAAASEASPTDEAPRSGRRAGRKPSRGLANLLDGGTSAADAEASDPAPLGGASALSQTELQQLVVAGYADQNSEVQLAARLGAYGLKVPDVAPLAPERELSVVERITLLRQVPFFASVPVRYLRSLALVCDEFAVESDSYVVRQGEKGGTLYIIKEGRIGIEQARQRGSVARLKNIGIHGYFGEDNLFSGLPYQTDALATQPTAMIRLRREPLLLLIRQDQELALALLHVMSDQIRTVQNQIAERTNRQQRPQELDKLFDQYV